MTNAMQAKIKHRVGTLNIDVDLKLHDGLGAITGPTAAGKSTLFHILCGSIRADQAKITFGDQVWQSEHEFVPSWQRAVGWVPQDALLFPHLTVRENLGFSGVEPARLQEIAERLAVDNILQRYPRHLSGGEKQRIAIGRALISPAKFMLLDEPFSALDKEMRSRTIEVVKELMVGRVGLIVSHQPSSYEGWAERVWLLQKGVLTETPGI